MEIDNNNIRASDLPETYLIDHVWQYSVFRESPYGRYVRFFSDRRIGGYRPENAFWWDIDDGTLMLLDPSGIATIIFDQVHVKDNRAVCLTGKFSVVNRAISCFLSEFQFPKALSSETVILDWNLKSAQGKRQNLVLIGADEKSIHHHWDRNISDEHRNWDFGIIFYGQAENYPPAGSFEFSVFLPKSSKFPALHKVLHEDSILWRYDRIWLPDDDIMISWENINSMFQICAQYNLTLAQPALTANSYISHVITCLRSGSLLRFVRFVEGMAPVFTSGALRMCIHTFDGVQVGWGLDHIWPKLLGEPNNGIAILDCVPMVHTRPVAGNYSSSIAYAEMNRLMAQYCVTEDFSEVGIIPDRL